MTKTNFKKTIIFAVHFVKVKVIDGVKQNPLQQDTNVFLAKEHLLPQ